MANVTAVPPVDHATVKVVPPLLYLLIFGLAWLVQRRLPLPLPGSPLLRLGGAALALGSVGLFHREHTSIFPIQPGARLVVRGSYRWTRNPMYLASCGSISAGR